MPRSAGPGDHNAPLVTNSVLVGMGLLPSGICVPTSIPHVAGMHISIHRTEESASSVNLALPSAPMGYT